MCAAQCAIIVCWLQHLHWRLSLFSGACEQRGYINAASKHGFSSCCVLAQLCAVVAVVMMMFAVMTGVALSFFSVHL